MPHECIKDSVLRTAVPSSIFSPVVGHMPPLAKVAAITEADSQVTSKEQSFVE